MVIGQSVPRREDRRLLTGSGRFLADLTPPGVLHVAIVRSTVPAGRITSIDTSQAERSDGVVAVLTGADLRGTLGPIPLLTTPDPRFARAFELRLSPPEVACIAEDEVRYVGEPVAVVVARDRYLAEDAADLVDVGYEPRVPIVDVAAALALDARPVHASHDDNVALTLTYQQGGLPDPDPSHVVVERELYVGRHSGVPLEGRGVLAEPGEHGIEIWTSTQIPYLVKRAICASTGWSDDHVRVRTPDVGGGFGPKANVYGEEILIPVIAERLDASVVWVEDRYEHLISASQARDQTHRTRLVVDADGRIVSFEDDFDVDIGAHNLWMVGTVANTAIHALGAYRIPSCRIAGTAVFTNKTPTAQYRGAGRPEATFALERTLDAAADALGIDRAKFREINVLAAGDLPYSRGIPYRDGVDIVYDGRDYAAVLAACQRLVPDDQIGALREAQERASRYVGVGIATFVEATGRGPSETARIELLPDGNLEVAVGTASAGMAHETTLAQVAASVTRRPMDAIAVRSGDTDGVPESVGTFASRTAVVAGSAVREAATALVRAARESIAELRGLSLEGVTHADDAFELVDGTQVGWGELACSFAKGGGLAHRPCLAATGRFAPETVTWTMGAHLAVVSVEPATGVIRVLRYAAADEGGVAINPRVVEGQVKGGIAQGIGGALLEEFRYDDTGQPTSTTLADYLLPAMGEVPRLDVAHVEVPSERNPLGARGVGESGAIPGSAAIAAAVEDALRSYGVQVTATPIRPIDVRSWLREAGA